VTDPKYPGYEYNKTWRYNHPEKRYSGKQRYYDKTRNAPNRRQPWSAEHERLVLEHTIPDSQLSAIIGRSVNAIQRKRTRLAKGN
jgi:hypothetical protein